jgi:hypothetical protein
MMGAPGSRSCGQHKVLNAWTARRLESCLLGSWSTTCSSEGKLYGTYAVAAPSSFVIHAQHACLAAEPLCLDRPAMGSGKIQKGDKIIKVGLASVLRPMWTSCARPNAALISCALQVDGEPVSAAGVDHALIGNDVPGSLIRLTVIKEGSGAEEEVAITRMATSKIADKRRMFELFSEIKDAYLKSKGGDSGLFGVKIPGVDLGGGIDISERVDEALKLWTKMQMREASGPPSSFPSPSLPPPSDPGLVHGTPCAIPVAANSLDA